MKQLRQSSYVISLLLIASAAVLVSSQNPPACGINGCEVCPDGFNCTDCRVGHRLTGNQCIRCGTDCLECNATFCNLCPTEFGPVLDGTSNCGACTGNCADCSIAGAGKCDVCKERNGPAAGGSCGACADNCRLCHTIGEKKCQVCLDGYELNSAPPPISNWCLLSSTTTQSTTTVLTTTTTVTTTTATTTVTTTTATTTTATTTTATTSQTTTISTATTGTSGPTASITTNTGTSVSSTPNVGSTVSSAAYTGSATISIAAITTATTLATDKSATTASSNGGWSVTTASGDGSNTTSSSGLSEAALFGIIAGAIAGALLLSLLALCCCWGLQKLCCPAPAVGLPYTGQGIVTRPVIRPGIGGELTPYYGNMQYRTRRLIKRYNPSTLMYNGYNSIY